MASENDEIARQLVEESGVASLPSWIKSRPSENKGASATDSVLALMEGMGTGIPFAGPARELGRFLGKKITGKERETYSDKSPIAGAVGEGVGMIPGFMAGGTAAIGSKIPGIAGKGILSALLRGGLVNTATSQMHDPTLDPTRIGADFALGAAGEAAPVALKKGASKLWETVLKRPTSEIAEEVLSGATPVEKTLAERGARFPRSFAELKEWVTPRGLGGMARQVQKEGRAVMPERNAIIARAGNPDIKTVVAPLKEKLSELRPGWGSRAKSVPGTEMPVGKLRKTIKDVESWVSDFGSAEDVEALKEIQQKMASNLYGKGELAPTDRIAKQVAQLTGRGARESLEEAAGAEGPRLAALNKTYGQSVEMSDALARAAAMKGKGVGLLPATLGLAGIGAGGLGQTEAGGQIHAGEASMPLLLMAALASPTGRMMAANMLAKSSPAMKAIGPFMSGPSKFFLEGDK